MKKVPFLPGLLILIASCAAGIAATTPQREELADLRSLATELAGDLLSRPWLQNFHSARGYSPLLYLEAGDYAESVSDSLRACLKRDLLADGRLRLVQARLPLPEDPDETARQYIHLLADFILSVEATAPAEGQELGQLELRLVDRASGELVWRQRREIPASAFARPETAT
jgi:hypothetical protein